VIYAARAASRDACAFGARVVAAGSSHRACLHCANAAPPPLASRREQPEKDRWRFARARRTTRPPAASAGRCQRGVRYDRATASRSSPRGASWALQHHCAGRSESLGRTLAPSQLSCSRGLFPLHRRASPRGRGAADPDPAPEAVRAGARSASERYERQRRNNRRRAALGRWRRLGARPLGGAARRRGAVARGASHAALSARSVRSRCFQRSPNTPRLCNRPQAQAARGMAPEGRSADWAESPHAPRGGSADDFAWLDVEGALAAFTPDALHSDAGWQVPLGSYPAPVRATWYISRSCGI